MDYKLRFHKKGFKKKEFKRFLLGTDIGGTNANFGIFGVKDGPELLFSVRFSSKKINSIVPVLNEVLRYAKEMHGIIVSKACIGSAGIVSADRKFCRPTNVSWTIRVSEIIKKTPIKHGFIINDFEAIGYGINVLNPRSRNDLVRVKHGSKLKGKTKAVIGAGTGLGKSILCYSKEHGAYIPLHSEGGHTDFPVYDQEELKLVEFIKKRINTKKPVSYEEVISGRGLEAIYDLILSTKRYRKTKYGKQILKSKDKAELISRYRKKDLACKEAFKIYTRFYARCAKNFALDTLARGGLYIAGGIAPKNKEIFRSRIFIKEFEEAYKQDNVLKKIPIFLVVNYDVGLLGAGFAGFKKKW